MHRPLLLAARAALLALAVGWVAPALGLAADGPLEDLAGDGVVRWVPICQDAASGRARYAPLAPGAEGLLLFAETVRGLDPVPAGPGELRQPYTPNVCSGSWPDEVAAGVAAQEEGRTPLAACSWKCACYARGAHNCGADQDPLDFCVDKERTNAAAQTCELCRAMADANCAGKACPLGGTKKTSMFSCTP